MGGDRFGEKHTYTYIKMFIKQLFFPALVHNWSCGYTVSDWRSLYRVLGVYCRGRKLVCRGRLGVTLAFAMSCTWRVLSRSQTLLHKDEERSSVFYIVGCFLHCWLFFYIHKSPVPLSPNWYVCVGGADVVFGMKRATKQHPVALRTNAFATVVVVPFFISTNARAYPQHSTCVMPQGSISTTDVSQFA